MTEYLNTINEEYINIVKKNIIHPRIKIELIDHTEQIIFKEIVQDIISSSGSITFNYQQGVRASCSIEISNVTGEYSPSSVTGMFWISSKFKLYTGLQDPDSEDIYWFSQGIFYTQDPIDNHALSSKTITITGVDKFGYLSGELGYSQLPGSYKIASGQNIYEIIKTLLKTNLDNGYVLDYVEPILDPIYKGEILPYENSKAQGGYLGDILIELANILGANIYYDKNGRLNVESGTLDISYSQEASIWDFTDIGSEYSNASVKYDYTKVINAVTVIGNNMNDKIYSWTAENHNPNSPTSIERIGRKEMSPIEVSLGYSEATAKDYAEFN